MEPQRLNGRVSVPRAEMDNAVDTCPVVVMASEEVDRYAIAEAIRQGRESLTRVPAHYRDAVIDHPEVQRWVGRVIHEAARRQVPNVLTGPSLLLLGAVGTGKTYQGFAAIRALAVSGAYSRWSAVTCADLYGRLRPRQGVDSEREFRAVADARVLLLDDLGAAKSSEWTEEVIYRLVNHRYQHRLPTLITSNLNKRDLAQALGERVASRLAEMTTSVTLTGTDRRRSSAPEQPTRRPTT